MRRARAFTLIEVVVALAIAAVLLTVVIQVLVLTLRDSRRTRVHSEMLRDADFVSSLLNTELRLAGLGVPSGTNIDPAYGTPPRPVTFYASLLVGGASEVGILGDLSRPDANYNPFGALHTRPTGGPTSIAWHNEDNGTCMPDSGAGTCLAGRDSVFFADDAAGCTATGAGAAFTDRKCPWGMRRLVPNERIQIAAGDGNWSTAAVTGSVQRVAAGVPPVGVSAAVLNPGYLVPPWANLLPGDGPGGIAGQGFLTTLDRVFYRQVGSTIVRRQCWGDPDPNQATNWPDAATNTVPTGTPQLAAGNGVTANECTDEEVVAQNVESLAFSYFDGLGSAVAVAAATKQDVRRIDYVIDFKKNVDGRDVIHQVRGSVRLENLP